MNIEEATEYINKKEWGVKDSNVLRGSCDMIFHSDFKHDIALRLSGDFPNKEIQRAILLAIVRKLNQRVEVKK